ncbi:major facilitator superfamily domain-containing protein [Microdochium trichocladiopsis]|uniref:Major facilitator superfamily domain-containing protein n=1 Tax=Microdochium trichocladiopsis TaxID=1682393 RepID=A0A9P8YFI0_9PEZI|nr:major facilitator superfamily domain-containing protein [Microdochium trichocladiopsis]KAH7037029.1 major facilitator superfamily domain-containing protein [Microdochium trichocladiopsis]
MNLASALTAGFAADVNIDQDTINLGNQLMYMGNVVLEIPSNMLLHWIGPQKWISAQVIMFGTTACLQVFVTNRAAFIATRLILGLTEAGYIPGGLYTLSTWYTRPELARRVAVFFFGMFGGNAMSPLLAAGILQLEGTRGLRGWQWLFLVEGLFTICVGVSLFLLLPGCPEQPRPFGSPGLVKFSTQDLTILQERLEAENPERKSATQGSHVPWAVVVQTVCQYRRWLHFLSSFCVFSTWSPLTTYTPSIIMSLGFTRIQANALAAVGASLALVVIFIFAWLSDRTQQRGATVLAGQSCYLVVLVVARFVHPHVGKWPRWALWTAINSFAVGYHPAHNTWLQVNCKDPRERSISIAMWCMSSISGMMVGARYFRAEDGPYYPQGLQLMIIMVSVGMLFAAGQMVVYIMHNKRLAKSSITARDGKGIMVYRP